MAHLHYQESASEEEKKIFSPYLAEDEELILATGYGSAYLRSIFVMALLWPGMSALLLALGAAYFLRMNLSYGFALGVLGMIVIALLKTMHVYHANRYLLTTRRVIIKKGLFAVQVTSALYDKITHIEVDQTFFDKLFMHHGTIKINTAGMNKGEITLYFVDYPIELKNLLERLINREREQFGMRSSPMVTVEGELV